MEEPERREMRIIDTLPEGWFTDRQSSSVWMSGYQLVRCDADSIPFPIVVDFLSVRSFFFVGSLTYFDSSNFQVDVQLNGNVTVTCAPAQKTSSVGVYLLLVTPFSVDGEPGNEALSKSQIDTAVGLIGAIYGKAAVFRHVFDNSVEVDSGQISATGPVFENPNWFSPVDFRIKAPDVLKQISGAISVLPEREQNRLALALRWFRNGQVEMDGSDAFIKFWIAIETLAFPEGDTNVRPANQKLARAYGLDFQDAAEKFGLGRMQGFRSDMIHNGAMKPVYAQILRYLEAVFVDLLSEELGLACERRAESILEDPEFSLAAYL
jgi:hypothetical protein